MRRITMSAFILASLCCAAASGEEAVRFTRKPTARADGDHVRIEFAVSAPTDVEVVVIDLKGKVVRHLAAGVLGKNAPRPLKKGSLSQSLLWDRTDDLGRAVAGGAVIRVSAGIRPALAGRPSRSRCSTAWTGRRWRRPTPTSTP